MHLNPNSRSSSRAFTLIELLVVIAIIAILAAILFPVFAQAKLAAKKTVDLSNIKQLSTAIIIYANDYDDDFPMTQIGNYDNWPVSTAMWSSSLVIGPYTKNTDLLRTPVDSIPAVAAGKGLVTTLPTTRPQKGLSFMPNAITNYSKTGDTLEWGCSNPQGAMPVSSAIIGGSGGPTSSTMVAQPSTVIMLANGYYDYVELYYGGGGGWENNEVDSFFYDWGGIYDQFIPIAIKLSTPGQSFYNSWRKFAGGANVSRTDTSAKFMHPDTLDDPHYWLISLDEGQTCP